jgi:hypothetical protein
VSDVRSDELPHPPGAELAWCEASGLAGVARLDVRPNEGACEAGLSFFLPDGGFITARHVAPCAAGDGPLEVEGVHFAMLEPERRWRLAYDGPGHSLGSVRDADKPDAWRRSRLERLIVELDVLALQPPAPSRDGFAQPVRSTGEVWVSGDRYELAALGMRGKSWGVAPAPRSASRFSLAFAADRALLVERVVLDDRREDVRGWVLRAGRTTPLRSAEVVAEAEDGSDLLPRAFRLALHDAEGGSHAITGELLHVAPLPGFRGRRDNLLCLGVARARWDDATGFGVAEFLHRLDAAGKPLEPVLRDAGQKL